MNLIVTIICLILFFVFGYRTLGEYGYTATPKLSLPFLEIKKQTVETKVNSGKNEKMSSFILYHSEPKPRTEILNQGKFDIYLHGTQFNGETKQIEHKNILYQRDFPIFWTVIYC